MKQIIFYSLVMMSIGATSRAYAEHPIDVERLSADNRHLQALVVFEKVPKRIRTPQTWIAAAKSAWALGLVSQAVAYLDETLQYPQQSISIEDRARVQFMKGIIAFQENNLPSAKMFALEAVNLAKELPGLLQASRVLLGDIYLAEHDYVNAKTEFEAVLVHVLPEEKGEIEFRLAQSYEGQRDRSGAIAAYQRVPVDSVRAPDAIRAIATLQLEEEKFDEVQFWLTKGRTDYPDKFLDSWVDYALVQCALKKKDLVTADEVAMRARASFPPSEGWMVLLEGALEKAKWDHAQEVVQGGAS